MAKLLVALIIALSASNACAFRAKGQMREEAHAGADGVFWGPSCSDAITGGEDRNSAWRHWNDKCKCPFQWVVAGSDPACAEKKGKRYFPKDLKANACICESATEVKGFVAIAYQKPVITKECAVEYGFGDFKSHTLNGLPDFLDGAHEWCNSNLVPEEKRVPEELRGLYWMKDLALDDVAFCPSLAEWDEDTLTAKMSVWNMFVFGKKQEEVVSHLAETAAAIPVLGGSLVYSIIFTNDTMKEADIKTNIGIANGLVSFPMWSIPETPDKTIQEKKPGDIFFRLSSIAGFETGTYFPVRIMDDDGTKHTDRYEFMKKAEGPKLTTFQRFKSPC